MGLSKLWGKDSTGAHGFVFSHIKTIYYNWAQKKLLSTKLDEMDTATSARLEKSKTLDDYDSIMSNQTAGFWPDALAVKEGFTQLNTDLEDIIVGDFGNASYGDSIDLPRAVTRNSVVFVFPSYNTSTTIRCNFAVVLLSAGAVSFTLYAFDTQTNDASVSNSLAGSYVVFPRSWD